MIALTRRGFVASAALASAAAAAGRATVPAPGDPVLLYDAGLAAGRRFAARAATLGGAALALDGDRVRQMRPVLARHPAALFGVSRHGDEVLLAEIAREAGYARIALIQHRAAGHTLSRCPPEGATFVTLARHAGARWPEAFAELALGGLAGCAPVGQAGMAEPAFSWVMARS